METPQDLETSQNLDSQGEQELEQLENIEQEIEPSAEKKQEAFKLFGIYDASEIKVNDSGMRRYINLEPKLVVKSYGRIREKFSKGKINILELFANLVAVPGHRGKKHRIQTNWKTGKYSQNMRIVLKCLEIIQKKTNQNPLQVLVTAIENAAPRDGITVIEYGGARYPQAVDISPLRRVTMTLRIIVQGSYDKSFNKKTKIEEALADEIIRVYKSEPDSYAMIKKRDSEKQADSAR